MISWTWLIVDTLIRHGYFSCDPKYQVDAYSLEENEFYVDRDPGDLFSFNSTYMVIDITNHYGNDWSIVKSSYK